MLASHHESLAETAPEGMSPSRVTLSIASTSSASEAEASTSSSSKDQPKKEPVTKRDHLDAAADLMTDIQVETYSSMDKREKTEL